MLMFALIVHHISAHRYVDKSHSTQSGEAHYQLDAAATPYPWLHHQFHSGPHLKAFYES